MDEVIPTLMADSVNSLLTVIPSMEEIHDAIFNLNKDISPGSYGFGGVFFQTYWNIVKVDLCNVVLQFSLHDGFSLTSM